MFFRKQKNILNEKTLLCKIFTDPETATQFFEKFFQTTIKKSDLKLSLKSFSKQFNLPSPAILFAQIYYFLMSESIKVISPEKVSNWIHQKNDFHILDIRDSWEREIASISYPSIITEQIPSSFPKEHPIVVVDHFGIKSKDICYELTCKGFRNVFVLEGGIERWSTEIDPSVPHYEGPAC